jgi:hypothetical protein
MKYPRTLRFLPAAVVGAVAGLLASCTSAPPPQPPRPVVVPQAPAAVAPQVVEPAHAVQVSYAPNPRAYRKDAAAHIYALNRARIWKGRMHPLLYAIGTLQVEVDGHGNVRHLNWLRAPTHAPEVIHEIERTVRAAAPFPVPAKMGTVVYTDTWLWDKSGRFQLDTLTEGQD